MIPLMLRQPQQAYTPCSRATGVRCLLVFS
nr:MAG TPA: hypothetical protein [Bacteriophage sp.]